MTGPTLSVVVVAYDMARELPRTIESLLPPYQRGLSSAHYEIIVVDNGSPEPVQVDTSGAAVDIRVVRVEDAPPSPAYAANLGIREAAGSLVGLIVDGARMASPTLLASALQASCLASLPVISPLAWHLGPVRHMEARRAGYDQNTEDELLTRIDWRNNPDQLFAVSTLAASSARGYFGPMGESSALFMPSAVWRGLGGLAEDFASPGGGYLNHDLYRRAALSSGVELITLIGEGTFHQIHGGAATSGGSRSSDMRAEYERLRGEQYRPPEVDALLMGRIPTSAHRHLQESVDWLVRRK